MKKLLLILTAAVIVFASCENFFHDLIPSSEDRILSFKVEGQTDRETITDKEIFVYVNKETDIQSIIPSIKTAPNASIIPVTVEYIQAAFPSANVVREAVNLTQTKDLTAYVKGLITEHKKDFSVPSINKPIDFSFPVNFLVIAASGNTRQYTVSVEVETAQIISLSFAKFDNSELVIDSVSEINKGTKKISVTAVYPAEMESLSYKLIPSFEINGDNVEIDGEVIESGVTPIQFKEELGSQSVTLTVTRGEIRTDYTLDIFFTVDPNTVRSITDFRFTKFDNLNIIAADAVASIIDSGDTGTITVQVLYTGQTPPVSLVPRFVTPGSITVSNVPQVSGETAQNFTAASTLEYRVLSRDGRYVRLYTVKVQFISMTQETPRMLSFSFLYGQNMGIIGDVHGDINDAAGNITVQVKYSGYLPPDIMVPEFSAQGYVTVFGTMQVSGSSEQDFSRQVKYTVISPVNSLLKKEYTVQCIFTRDDSSDATISAFGFYPENNLGLMSILSARVDQNTGKISLFAPVGSEITNKVMIPQFSATGHVNANGIPQRSGATGFIFNEPVEYVVTSANGKNSRTYIVEVKELGRTIFVNQNASGLNDGTNWNDAYISLKSACEAASQFDREIPKEIWIASGTYKPLNTDDYYPVAPNTTLIGGFAGNEQGAAQRNTALNKVIIAGNPVKLSANNVHAAFFNRELLLSGEDIRFEDIEFRDFTHNARGTSSFTYIPISLRWGSNAEGTITLKNCGFYDVNAPCIETSNGNVRMETVQAQRIAAMYSNNKAATGLNLVTKDHLDSVKITEQIQYGNSGFIPLFLFYGGDRNTSTLTVSNTEIENAVLGFKIHGNETIIEISGLEASNFNTVDKIGGDKGSILEIYGGSRLDLNNIAIDEVVNGRSFLGTIFLNEIRGNMKFENISITNVSVTAGDTYGGAGGISVNFYNRYASWFDDIGGNIVYKGNTIEMKNIVMHNIELRTMPVFNIYRPDTVIRIENLSMKPHAVSGSTALNFGQYRSLYADKLNFETTFANTSYTVGSFTFQGDTVPGEIDINDITAVNSSVSFSGSYKDIEVTKFLSNVPRSGNLSVSGTRANIVIDDIKARDLSISSYRSLLLTNAFVSRELSMSSYSYDSSTTPYTFYHLSTEIDNLKMEDTDTYSRYNMSAYNGIVNVKNSIFRLNLTSSYSSGSFTLNSYTTDMTYPLLTAVFDNCDFYDRSTITYYKGGGYNYSKSQNTYDFIFRASQNANLVVRNSRFNFNTSKNYGAVYAIYGGKFDMDEVTFTGFNTSSQYLLWVVSGSGTSGRINKENSFYKGTAYTGAREGEINGSVTFY